METNSVIEKRTVDGVYAIPCEQAIINDADHGLILITQGFGGGDVEGQTYRWKHGLIAPLLEGDNFEWLDQDSGIVSNMERVLSDNDNQRELWSCSGRVVEMIAEQYGL